MKDLIEMYNDYRNQKTQTIKESYSLRNNYTVEDFNISVITLFDWVRLEHKRYNWIESGRAVKHKSLKIHDNAWCDTLRKIVTEEPSFSRYFKVNGEEITFSDTLTEKDRIEFCRKATEELVVVSQDLYR